MPLSSWLRKLTTRFSSRSRKPTKNAARRFRYRHLPLRLERLEERAMPAIFTVTTAADIAPPLVVGSPVSLRQAIAAANANGTGHDDIVFNIPGGAPQVLTLTALAGGALPAITSDLTIDGTSQPGYSFGVPAIILNNAGFGGMSFTGGSGINFTLFGMEITNAAGSGLIIQGAGNNTITLQDVIAHDNTGDGINVFNVGNVSFTSAPLGLAGVTAFNNVGGLTVNRATSLTIIDGNFFDNDDGGIRISDIGAGGVTLTRTDSFDNDFDLDFVGNGVEILDGADADSLGIAGPLNVRGGFYGAVDDAQFIGIFVQSVSGAISFVNSTGPAQQVVVTGNDAGGVFIQNGGTGATVTNGIYSNNGFGFGTGSGFTLFSVAGTAAFTNVTAEGNFDHGLDVDAVTTLNVTGGFFRLNVNGLDLDGITGGTLTGMNADDNLQFGLSLEGSSIGAGGITISNSTFNNTPALEDQVTGIFLDTNSGNVNISGVEANNLLADGVHVEDHTAGTVSVSSSNFLDNVEEGLDFLRVTAVVTDSVMATGNDPGISIVTGTSYTDGDSTFSGNFDHGIFLQDLSGAVTLTRTIANDNDADTDDTGDGLHAQDGPDGGTNAIGSLTINGGSYSIVSGSQSFGVFVTRVGGAVLFQNAGIQQVVVDNNDEDGVRILGGTDATFANGFYTGNDGFNDPPNVSDGDGIHLENFTGTVTFDGVTATDNQDDGMDVDVSLAATVDVIAVTAEDNIGNGLEVENVTSVGVNGGTFVSNDTDGIFVDTVSGDVNIFDVVANDNGDDGLDADDIAGTLTIDGTGGGDFNNNDDNGLEIDDTTTVDIVNVTSNLNSNEGLDADGNTTVNVTGSDFDDNDDNGIVIVNTVDVNIDSTTASNNGDEGLFGTNITGTISISQSTFNLNASEGIQLIDVGDVVFSVVTASSNTTGALIDTADSFSDTDGAYDQNDNHGIHLIDILNDVTLDTTRADDNNFDLGGTGDGVFAEAVNNVDAIGGNLTVSNSLFRDTVAAGTQINGLNVTSVGGSTSVGDSTATGNVVTGLNIDAGLDATISGGVYSDNGDEGIELSTFTATIDILFVTANDNDSVGIALSDIGGTISISFTDASDNGADGIDIDPVADVNISDTTVTGNGGNGIEIDDAEDVTFINVVATSNGDDGADIDTADSFSDTDGVYSDNETHGILLVDIANDVSLVRTIAQDNDSNDGGAGDGFHAEADNNADAIGGNLLVQGGDFSNKTIGSPQQFGIFVDGVGGDVHFPLDIITFGATATGNEEDGIFIQDIGGDATFTGTTASDNGDDGIDLDNLNDLLMDLVDASSNGGDGVEVDNAGDVTIGNSTMNDNDDNGLAMTSVGDVFIDPSFFNDNGSDGIFIDGANDVNIQNATTTGNFDDGIDLQNVGNVTIGNATSTGNTGSGDASGLEVDSPNSLTVDGGTFSNNEVDGIGVDLVTVNLVLTGVTANSNGEDGLDAVIIGGTTTITGGQFNDNGEFGISILVGGPVTTQGTAPGVGGVVATGNASGVVVSGVTSYSDTDGNVSSNDDGGILLTDIAANVTLVRTTADNNDADNDGLGDGVNAVLSVNAFAIGGNLLVQGARFRDTGGAATHQENGIFVQSIDGNVTFENSAGVVQSMTVTGNEADGVNIDGDGTASDATFTLGTYSNNGDDGIDLDEFDDVVIQGTGVSPNNLTANGNGDDGINVTDSDTVTLSFVTMNSNLGLTSGFEIDNVSIVFLNDLTTLSNTSGLGGVITNVTGIFFDPTTTPDNTADTVELFPESAGFNSFQHTRAGSVQQPIRYCTVLLLDVDFLGGDDTAIINAGDYSGCLFSLDLDGGAHNVGDTLTYNATNNPDTIDLNGTVVTINGVVQPDVGGAFAVANFEFLAINGLLGNDTFTVTDWPAAGQFAVTTLNGNEGNDSMDASGAPLEATPGQYVMNGNDGNDTIRGSVNAELITGGNNDDALFGGGGNDSINGDAGNDSISGQAGDDSLTGGTGSDTYQYAGPGPLGSDTIVETAGNVENDWFDFSNFTPADLLGVTLDLGVASLQEVNPGDVSVTLSSTTAVENAVGSNQDDNITGNTAANTLLGLDGDDNLNGVDGNDTMAGGNDDDLLTGGIGNDSMTGNNGDDTMNGGSGNDTTAGGADDDLYVYSGTLLGSDSVVEAPNVDTDTMDFTSAGFSVNINLSLTTLQTVNAGNCSITFSSGTGLENVEGSANNDSITGNSRNNLLNGNNGADSIQGGTGNDTVNGGDGNDTLRGGPATVLDIVTGGPDNDLIIWDQGDGNQMIDGNSGTDTTQVNGASTAENFTLQQDGGDPTRQDFDRTTATAFNLDVGTVEVYDINMNAGNDTFTMFSPISGPGNGDVTTLDVDGGNDNDLIRFDFTAANILPATTTVSGGLGSDTTRIQGGGAAFSTETYTPTGPNSGNIDLDGQDINYSQMERLQETKAADDLVFNATAGNDSVTISDGPLVNGFDTSSIVSANNLFVALDFANKDTATVFGQLGSDTFLVTNPDPADGLTQMIFNGGTNANPALDLDSSPDVFRVQPSSIPYFVNGGNPVDTCPGDVLEFINLPAGVVPDLTLLTKYSGFYTFPPSALATVNFTSIEDFPGIQIIVVGTDFGTGPRIRMYDALDGTQLLNFKPFADLSGFKGGVRVAAGDVNGDCYPDIVAAGGPGAGGAFVRVFDGYQARLGIVTQIASFKPYGGDFNKGLFVAVGDFSGDGLGDLVVTTGGPAKPRVRVFDGGDVLTMSKPPHVQFNAFPDTFKGGATVAVGDYNGDGVLDIVTGAGPTGTPRVRVFDGANFSLIDDFLAFDAAHRRGVYVGTSDVDNDGVAEIIVTRNASGLSEIQPFDLQISPALNVKPEARTFDFTVNQNGNSKLPTAVKEIYPPNYTSGVRVGGWSDGETPINAAGDIGQFLSVNGPGVTPSIVKKLDQFLTELVFVTYPTDATGFFVNGSQRRFGLPLP